MGFDDDDDVKKRNDFNDDVDVNYDEDDDNDNEYDMTGLPRPFVICGPEGYRKDVLMKMLIKDLGAQIFGTVLLHTTRQPLEDEKDVVHFHFTDVETIEKGIKEGKFIEYCKVLGDYYGTGF